MAGQGPGPGVDAIGVAVATAITSVIITALSGKVADVLAGSGEGDTDKMYEEFHSKIGKSRFHIEPGKKVVSRKIETMMDQPQTMAFVNGAIEQLKEAKKTTHCGVCQKKLDAAIHAVVTEAKIIKVSDAKWQIIQALKEAGKIPKNLKWDQMTPKQKSFINKLAEKGV